MQRQFKIWKNVFLAIYAIVLLHSFIPHNHNSEFQDNLSALNNAEVDWLNWLHDLHHEDMEDGHMAEFMIKSCSEFDLELTNFELPFSLLDSYHLSITLNKNETEIVCLDLELLASFSNDPNLLRGPPIC